VFDLLDLKKFVVFGHKGDHCLVSFSENFFANKLVCVLFTNDTCNIGCELTFGIDMTRNVIRTRQKTQCAECIVVLSTVSWCAMDEPSARERSDVRGVDNPQWWRIAK